MPKSIPHIFILLCLTILCGHTTKENWGFYGHKRINQLAVFTLPPPLIGFYKQHIDYVRSHAVDPDKRRYAVVGEAVKHYIDLDEWGEPPFDTLPRYWLDAKAKFATIILTHSQKDTLRIKGIDIWNNCARPYCDTLQGFKSIVARAHHLSFEFNDKIPIDSFKLLPTIDSSYQHIQLVDEFSHNGTLPYNIERVYNQLVKAMEQKDVKKILKYSADIGHYIGDAHVPLHTTKNYNGQLTNQIGIHSFWESRIPELFADKDYDFFVGTAVELDDVHTTIWDFVLHSHTLVDDVLTKDAELKQSFPSDQQYCFEERLNVTTKLPCSAFAAAYQKSLNGMIEQQMRASIKTIGDIWYTAWITAGKPDLNNLTAEAITTNPSTTLPTLEEELRNHE